MIVDPEAVAWRCSLIKDFLKISQNSKENTCASLFFNNVAGLRRFSGEFYEMFKNIFLYKTPPVAASVDRKRITS